MLDVSRSDLVAAVAGAGTMGRGIVQVLAQCGARTLVYDAKPGAAAMAKDTIGQSLGKLAEKGRLKPAEVQATLGRIEVADSLQGLAPCHVVIEAIVEDLNEKRKLFGSLENVVAQSCILASNTSSLSVTAMAAACQLMLWSLRRFQSRSWSMKIPACQPSSTVPVCRPARTMKSGTPCRRSTSGACWRA